MLPRPPLNTMKTKGHLPVAATVLLFVLVCCIELASGKPSDRKKQVTRDSELHQDQRMTVDAFMEGHAASRGSPVDTAGVLNHRKLNLTARLALLENARRERDGIGKKRPIVNPKPRPKRNLEGFEPEPLAAAGDPLAAAGDPLAAAGDPLAAGGDLDLPFGDANDYDLLDSALFADWSECNETCGIGYQELNKNCEPSECDSLTVKEVRRCLGIDCKSPEYLEAKLSCYSRRSSPSIAVGIVVGIIMTLATAGVAFLVMRFKSGEGSETSSSKTKEKGSSRPPKPAPRDGEAKDADIEHIYEEVDGQSKKKAKASNSYVSMRKKDKSKKKTEKKEKSKKKPASEDSDHTYVDPDELNQPNSEDLEIQRLRDPPPPPDRKSKKSSKRKKENEYEVPKEDDYMEIDE